MLVVLDLDRAPPRVAGDLVAKGDSTRDWQTYFSEMFNLGVQVPYYTVLGNHEYDDANYFNLLDIPHNGTPEYDEHWYYMDYSNVRIIGLDSNTNYRIQEQLDWLEGVLADAEANDHIDFVFAQLHHPYLSELWVPGEIDYTGELVFEVVARGERAEVRLDRTYSGPPFGPFGLLGSIGEGDRRWDVRLSPRAALDLTVDSGSGGCELDLSELQIADLELDVGSGSVDLTLPAGSSFSAVVDGGSGTLTVVVPSSFSRVGRAMRIAVAVRLTVQRADDQPNLLAVKASGCTQAACTTFP